MHPCQRDETRREPRSYGQTHLIPPPRSRAQKCPRQDPIPLPGISDSAGRELATCILLAQSDLLQSQSTRLDLPLPTMSLARSLVSPIVSRAQLARRIIAPVSASASASFSSSSSSLASSSASSSKPKATKRRGCSSCYATKEVLELTRLRSD
jgi:hypothetical protein